MTSNKILSRTAGLLYLIVILGIMFAEFYVRGNLVVWGDAMTTAQNILNSESLFRYGFVIELIAEACNLLLVLALYQLFKSVNKFYAIVMVACVVVFVSIKSINMLNEYAVILLLKGGGSYLSAMTADQINALVLFFFNMHSTGFDISGIFFSLWLLPLGYLVYHSGNGGFSRILGVWLMISCFALLTNFITRFLYPHFYRDTIFWITGAIDSSEIVLCFWLIFKKVNIQNVE